jgi:cell division protein FtsB
MSFVNIKTIALLITMLILLFIIKNIVSSIISLRQNSHIVTTLQEQEQEGKQRKQFLEQRLYFVNTTQFIENQAREKLGLVKPGEHIVLAPPPISHEEKVAIVDTTPNWQKWWKLFF